VPGRFPLLTDENVPGPLIEGLRARGWDVLRVVDAMGVRSVDETVEHCRVLVSTDSDCLVIARRWIEGQHRFRLIYWQQGRHQRVPFGSFIDAFEALTTRDDAFATGIEYLRRLP
jgi:hypothetical protein